MSKYVNMLCPFKEVNYELLMFLSLAVNRTECAEKYQYFERSYLKFLI